MNHEEENALNAMIITDLLEYCRRNPYEITSLNVGSGPRTTNLKEFDEKQDQILPKFIRNIIDNTDQTIRIIHFDPMFHSNFEFLHAYFNSQNIILNYNNSDQINRWITPDYRVEIMIFPILFESNTLYSNFALNSLITNTKLIVQCYTGIELDPIFQELYSIVSNKEQFKNNILFDISYGKDCHCMTDMSKYEPLYDAHGNFVNLTLLNESELNGIINRDSLIDDYIKTYYVKKYKKIINLTTDYRRKIKGDTILFHEYGYTNDSSPDEIMHHIIEMLLPIINILRELNVITQDKLEILRNLFSNYYEIDMYKVYNDLNSAVNL